MGSKKYLNTWGAYIKVLKMLETWLHGMSDTSNETLERVYRIRGNRTPLSIRTPS